jgi:NAD+ diphosphatase
MEFEIGLGSVFKYCPKCGAAAMRVVGLKMFQCTECGFELYLNPAAAVAGVIVDEQGRMVVLVRGKEPGRGKWDLPGGFVDPGDTAEEALRREVREEIGLEVTALRYLGSGPNVYEFMGVRYRTLDLGFLCEVADASGARPMEPDIAEVLFLSRPEIDFGRFAFPSVARIAGWYLEQRAGGGDGKDRPSRGTCRGQVPE